MPALCPQATAAAGLQYLAYIDMTHHLNTYLKAMVAQIDIQREVCPCAPSPPPLVLPLGFPASVARVEQRSGSCLLIAPGAPGTCQPPCVTRHPGVP